MSAQGGGPGAHALGGLQGWVVGLLLSSVLILASVPSFSHSPSSSSWPDAGHAGHGADLGAHAGHDHAAHDHSGHGDGGAVVAASAPAPGAAHSHGMAMAFEASLHVTVLFSSLSTHGLGGYAALLLGVFVLALAHEALTAYRAAAASAAGQPAGTAMHHPSAGKLLSAEAEPRWGSAAAAAAGPQLARALRSGLYVCSTISGYALMLAVMSFNVGVFLAVVAGLGVGHFLFNAGRAPGSAQLEDHAC